MTPTEKARAFLDSLDIDADGSFRGMSFADMKAVYALARHACELAEKYKVLTEMSGLPPGGHALTTFEATCRELPGVEGE